MKLLRWLMEPPVWLQELMMFLACVGIAVCFVMAFVAEH